jgi:hypothetical protein
MFTSRSNHGQLDNFSVLSIYAASASEAGSVKKKLEPWLSSLSA